MALPPGTRLGPYEIADQIGAGGMGEVYRATDTNLKRAVAIKVMPVAVAADAERLARFQREAEVLAALNHPHIAAIYGLERSAGTIALVMELVEGPTLADRIARGAVPVDEARRLATQLADALEYAHERGIIHRDLKPANIKVRDDGTVKVLDFGLAKALDPGSGIGDQGSGAAANSPTITSPAMTMRGVILGTAAYMSPEQARGDAVDTRADIWAFGVVFFEMLTGGRCFDGPSMTDVLASVVKSEPDWSLLPADVPAGVRALLRRCLRKDARARLRDIGDARIELMEPVASEAAAPARATTWRDRAFRFAPWAVAVLAVVSAGLLLLQPAGLEQTAVTRHFDLVLPESAPLEFVGEANFGAGQTALALSRDGTRLAYVGTAGETTRLWLYDLRSGLAKPLENTSGAYHPFFSPDGEWVAFFAADQLKKVSVTTGEVVTITKAPNPYGGDWRDDNLIVMSVKDAADFVVMSADGSARSLPSPSVVSGRKGLAFGPLFPSFLPGSEWVVGHGCALNVLCARSLRTGEINVLTINGPAPEADAATTGLAGTFPRYVGSGHLLYARAADGMLVALPFDPRTLTPRGPEVALVSGIRRELPGTLQLAIGHDGTAIWAPGPDAQKGQFVWVDGTGRREPLPIPADAYGDFKLSPSRRWLAAVVTGVTGRPEIRFFDLERQGTSYHWSDTSFAPTFVTWLPDETAVIAFSSGPDTARRVRRDGTGVAADVGVGVHPEHVLADSTIVAQIPHQKENRFVWPLAIGKLIPDGRLPTPAALLEKRIATDHESPGFASLSPDGKWLTFTSSATGPYEVYVVHAPFTGSATRVSTSGGEEGLWAPDGRLFYRNGRRWYVVEPTRNAANPFSDPRFVLRGNFSNVAGMDYAISADGRRLLVLQEPGEPARSLHVITNWFDELRRLAPARN